MAVSGHDLRQSLEAAIAAKYSALWGSVPLSLPLGDRSLTLYPTPYRWLGGDQIAEECQVRSRSAFLSDLKRLDKFGIFTYNRCYDAPFA